MSKRDTKTSDVDWESFVARFAEIFRQELDGVGVQLGGDSGSEFPTDDTCGDGGDQGTRQYELAMAYKRRQDLLSLQAELRAALERIADKTYGVCLSCGEMIDVERLIAVPLALYHVNHIPAGRLVNNGRRKRR